jgi:heme-degrading monooxygenase HmoA
MILEIAVLNVRPGQGAAFEQAFADAQAIISSIDGYISHQLQRCLEAPDKYLLLVHWRRLEDHTVGFRQSAKYQLCVSLTVSMILPLCKSRPANSDTVPRRSYS